MMKEEMPFAEGPRDVAEECLHDDQIHVTMNDSDEPEKVSLKLGRTTLAGLESGIVTEW